MMHTSPRRDRGAEGVEPDNQRERRDHSKRAERWANVGLKYSPPIGNGWSGVLAGEGSYRGSRDAYFAAHGYNVPLDSPSSTCARASRAISGAPWPSGAT
jgi:hypothetical protein